MTQDDVRTLVVEDDPLFMKLVSTWLETNNIEVKTASSAEAAIEILKSQGTDILITDLKMEGLGGMGLIHSVLTNGWFPADRILVITGEPQPSEDSQWLSDRNIPILHKPFTLKSLLEKVAAILKRS